MKIKYRVKWTSKVNYFTLLFFFILGISLFYIFFYDKFTKNINLIMGLQLGSTALIQIFFLIQKRMNRGIVVLLFNLFIYYLCFFFLVTKIDITGFLNAKMISGESATYVSLTTKINWITTYMCVNLLIVSVAIHILLFVFFLYDVIWNKFFIKKYTSLKIREFSYYWQSIINLVVTISFGFVVFYAFRITLSTVMKENFIFSENDRIIIQGIQGIEMNLVKTSLDNYTKLLNIAIYPVLSLFSVLIKASAVGDNSSLKNVAFKSVVIAFTSWNISSDGLVIWIIALTYFAYSLIFVIVSLSGYFTVTIDKQTVPVNYLFQTEREMITVDDQKKNWKNLWTSAFYKK